MPDITLPSTPSERLQAADTARRRLVIRGISAIVSCLSLLAFALLVLLRSPALTAIASAGAALGSAAAFWLAGKDRPLTWAALVLLATLQLEHVFAALGLGDLGEVRDTLMFSGVIPLIAGVAVRVRGTVVVTMAGLASVLVLFAVELQRGWSIAIVARALGAPLFFVLLTGVVGVSSALATRRSILEQTAREAAKRKAEVAAKTAEARLRVIADQVSDLVAVLDARGRFTLASASFERILNLEPERLYGQTARDLVHPEDFAAAQEAFFEALPKQSRELVVRVRSADASYRTFHLRMLGVDLEGGPHVAVAARDITLLQSSNAEHEATRRMDALSKLAGGVAHDFNNLLSVIGSCGNVVSSKLAPEHEAQRELKVIDDAVEQAATLTGQLLAFARHQFLPRSRVVPGAAVAEMAPLLQRTLGEHVKLELDTRASQWATAMNAGQLEQILMNLTVNARDAMPEGGTVHVRIADVLLRDGEVRDVKAGDHVLVEVRDTGTGMPPEVCARVFEPFFSTKGPARGTGLGLATSFGIARQSGGTLTVESQVGQGSTFRLYLPRSEGAALSVPTPEERYQLRPGPQRVLVLDDEQRIRDLVGRLLEMAGHEPVLAATPEEAFACSRAHTFDVILTDVLLGQRDGLDALAELRRLQPQARAVVMSGFSPSPERLVDLRETGVGFLAKPFSVESLLQTISNERESL